MTNTDNYFVIQNKTNKWFLGIDNTYSTYNPLQDNTQRFDTSDNAKAKLAELNTAEDKVRIHNIRPSKIDIKSLAVEFSQGKPNV